MDAFALEAAKRIANIELRRGTAYTAAMVHCSVFNNPQAAGHDAGHPRRQDPRPALEGRAAQAAAVEDPHGRRGIVGLGRSCDCWDDAG